MSRRSCGLSGYENSLVRLSLCVRHFISQFCLSTVNSFHDQSSISWAIVQLYHDFKTKIIPFVSIPLSALGLTKNVIQGQVIPIICFY